VRPPAGLAVGTAAPYLPGGWSKESPDLLLVFTESGCGACDALKPELDRWGREFFGRLAVEVIASRDIAQSYLVTATPSAVLIVAGKVAAPLAAGADTIRDLVRRATLPAPVKRGEPMPPLALPDLDGATVDLAGLRGSRTLILFWSPSCGYCQQMLDDLKRWERDRPPNAPELLIVSSGSSEENRKQGFGSRVLLDPGFSAQSILGAGGTPSAVLINESGIVDSEVRAGASEVLALAGW